MNSRKRAIAICMVVILIGLPLFSCLEYPMDYQTQRYDVPAYVDSSTDIIIETGILTLIIEKSQPAVTFFYQPDGGNIGRFGLAYNSIIAYNDTGDGVFGEAETLYKCVLSSSQWSAGQVMSLEDSEHGKFIVFSMSSSLTMTPTAPAQGDHSQGGRQGNPISDWATMTLTYMIAEKNYTRRISNQLAYNVTGNTELKIDINLTFSKSLPARNMTIEQFLYENEDLQQDHVFRLHESTGITMMSSGSRQAGPQGLIMNRFGQLQQLQQRIAYATTDGIEEGYYSWIPPFNVTSTGGISSIQNFSTSYGTSGSELRIYYSMPYSADRFSIFLDPVIGIIESGFLQAIGAFIVEHSESLIVGAVIGVITVIGILYSSSRRKSGEEDETVDLGHNPYYSGNRLNYF